MIKNIEVIKRVLKDICSRFIPCHWHKGDLAWSSWITNKKKKPKVRYIVGGVTISIILAFFVVNQVTPWPFDMMFRTFNSQNKNAITLGTYENDIAHQSLNSNKGPQIYMSTFYSYFCCLVKVEQFGSLFRLQRLDCDHLY